MALQKKATNSSRLIIVGITVVVVGVIGYVLFRQFYLADIGTGSTNTTTDRTNRVIRDFGESILQDQRYKSLIEYGTAPAEPAGSNPNPFQ